MWKKQERATHVSLHNKVKVEEFDSIWPVLKYILILELAYVCYGGHAYTQ